MYVWIVILTPHSPTPFEIRFRGRRFQRAMGWLEVGLGGWGLGGYKLVSKVPFVNSHTSFVGL